MISNENILSSQAMAGRVTRYHTWPVLRKQTIAEHAWRVATIYCDLFGVPGGHVLYHIIHHDSGELNSGDMPFLAKRNAPQLKSVLNDIEAAGHKQLGIELPVLAKHEWARFKLCDLLEMLEYACIEINMGNQYAAPIKDNILQGLRQFEGLEQDIVSSAALRILLATGHKDSNVTRLEVVK